MIMSYFYLQPIVGNIQLHMLEECVYQRFKYLSRLYNREETPFCEYLIEGSALDNIAHFVLGVLVRFSGEKTLLDFVNRAEELLFLKRIESAGIDDIRLLCKTILRSIKDQSNSCMKAITIFCRQLIVKHIAGHVLDKNHGVDCISYKIYLNFTYCLPFVSKRLVVLEKGIACIPCGLWKQFLVILFNMNLHTKFDRFDADTHLKFDPRWQDMLTRIKNSFFVHNVRNNISLINHNDIDQEMLLFPLCMKNLHEKLRKNHRLSHDERFRYSLFLKGIGLPLQQSIYFWQKEYSKPCSKNNVCTHNWHEDEKRYVYGLRHLYGLEGGRKNYHMSTCSRLQSKSCTEGCAFKHFDDECLKNLVHPKILTRTDWNVINLKRKSGSCGEACFYYRNVVLSHLSHQSSISKINRIFSPVDYYIEFKKILQ